MKTGLFSRVAGLALLAACGEDVATQPSSSGGDPPPSDVAPAPTTQGPGPTSNDPVPSEACTKGDAVCTAKDKRRACVDNGAGGTKWVDETCGAGSGCYAGACTPGKCSDECTAGTKDASGKTCTPYDLKTGK